MTLEIQPCRSVMPASPPRQIREDVEVCDPEAAEFWGLYRRSTGDQKLAFHIEDFPTREAAQAALDYELRCQAFEAEGMTRSDAQGLVDLELQKPQLRATAHGLPQQLADAGYRIEFGDENCDQPLIGQWWWTFSRHGDTTVIQVSELQYASSEAAVAGAQAAYDDAYEISVEDTCEDRIAATEHLLRDLVAWQAAKFDEDVPDKSISGADAVDFIAEIRERAKRVLGMTKGA